MRNAGGLDPAAGRGWRVHTWIYPADLIRGGGGTLGAGVIVYHRPDAGLE